MAYTDSYTAKWPSVALSDLLAPAQENVQTTLYADISASSPADGGNLRVTSNSGFSSNGGVIRVNGAEIMLYGGVGSDATSDYLSGITRAVTGGGAATSAPAGSTVEEVMSREHLIRVIREIVDSGTDFSVEHNADGTHGDVTATNIYVNETSNSQMTIGLTINQGANDDEIVALKSSDVAHGITDVTETDTYGLLKRRSGTAGGLLVTGLRSGGTVGAINFEGVMVGNAATGKSATSHALIRMQASQASGTSLADVIANGNLLSVEAYSTGDYATRAIFDAEGDLHLDATLTQNAWDGHDDLALLHGLRASLVPELEARFGRFVEEARPILEQTGVVTYNEDGHHFIAMKKFAMLLCDALRQLGERHRQLETQMERYERALIELGADPKG